jgi:hypothetical protein
LAHSFGWNRSTNPPMRDQSPDTVRSPALQSMALRRTNTFLIGLMSGLYSLPRRRAGGRKEHEAGACCLNRLADAGMLVAGQVVHDHHVAACGIGHEDLSNMGLEPVAVDRAVEHHRCDHAGHAQGGDRHGRLAMAVRVVHPQLLAPAAAAAAAAVAVRHVGRRPGLRRSSLS